MTSTTTVRELLKSKKPDIWSIGPKATVYDALVMMDEKDIGALVVMDEKNEVVGIVSERDYARKVASREKTRGKTLVEEVMTPVADMYRVKPETTVEDCMVLITGKEDPPPAGFRRQHVRRHRLHRRRGQVDHIGTGNPHRALEQLHCGQVHVRPRERTERREMGSIVSEILSSPEGLENDREGRDYPSSDKRRHRPGSALCLCRPHEGASRGQ